MFLARKITRAKWVDAHLNSGEIPADAVTVDLRTRNNTLSFWQCGDATEEELDEAVLALAAAAQRVESIDIVWLSYDELHRDWMSLQDLRRWPSWPSDTSIYPFWTTFDSEESRIVSLLLSIKVDTVA